MYSFLFMQEVYSMNYLFNDEPQLNWRDRLRDILKSKLMPFHDHEELETVILVNLFGFQHLDDLLLAGEFVQEIEFFIFIQQLLLNLDVSPYPNIG